MKITALEYSYVDWSGKQRIVSYVPVDSKKRVYTWQRRLLKRDIARVQPPRLNTPRNAFGSSGPIMNLSATKRMRFP